MDSYFQEGVKLKGVLHSKGVLHVGGEFEGEIFSSEHLVIGKGGFVKGKIKTYDITNMGTIQGDVEAENKVNLKENSELTGDIKTHQLIVDEGSNFEGQCHMTKAKPEPRSSSPPKKKNRLKNSLPSVKPCRYRWRILFRDPWLPNPFPANPERKRSSRL